MLLFKNGKLLTNNGSEQNKTNGVRATSVLWQIQHSKVNRCKYIPAQSWLKDTKPLLIKRMHTLSLHAIKIRFHIRPDDKYLTWPRPRLTYSFSGSTLYPYFRVNSTWLTLKTNTDSRFLHTVNDPFSAFPPQTGIPFHFWTFPYACLLLTCLSNV